MYSLLGDTVEDGIFAWISFGIDLTVQENITAAVAFGENGGVANADSGMGGGPNGTMPSGSPPSGTATGIATETASTSTAA